MIASTMATTLTKDDYRELKNVFATKDDLKRFATKDDLAREIANCATKDDLAKMSAAIRSDMATKDDLAKMSAAIRSDMATKDDIEDGIQEIVDTVSACMQGVPTATDHLGVERRVRRLEEKAGIKSPAARQS